MIDNEVSFTSLCYITVDYEGRIWLNRLADVEDDILHTPFKSERTDNYFENRDRLYRNDGPTALGTVGIWEWTAIPNRDNPTIDYVQSHYVKDYSPVRVVVLMAKSLDEVVEQLQNGTARTQAYFCDTLFCYEPKWGQFAGVLCRANEFNISDRCAKLSETVYSLPSYTISSGDIYNWDDRNLRFLKTLQAGEPSGYVSIGNTNEVIRTLILERTTWPLFKECIGATKAEWKHCKLLLEKICGESLYDAIVQKLNCTLDQAKQAVDDFVNRADGIDKDKKFSTDIRGIMGWGDNDPIAAKWSRILREKFMDEGQSSNGKYYIDLSRVKPRFDLEHTWFRCERCSELTPYLLRGKCPSCQCEKIHPMTAEEIDALDFWRAPIDEALRGETIRVIDTEEHTAQLSHKDQRDELWSKTEQYELRFQDFLQDGEAPVDILSSTTTMEVGIDIGSLVAVGLRNIPPMRENYQQRAGRAGRRGSSLSTIVTFCEDGPHDSLYFSNPVPMFRGDPRRPWIDIGSEKIVQRHLGMVALQSYLRTKANSLDAISAIEFLDDHLQPFSGFLTTFKISENDILVPANSQGALYSYKGDLEKSLFALKQKRDNHPELFETDDNSDSGKKTLLDALYEEGIIPTYSFPKNVVSTYISDMGGKVKYQVERGLDVAIGEYAPGRAIVVDKTTYQIGGLYYPGGERSERTAASPARSFINDASYRKTIRTCGQCGWFGLEEDNHEACPFCGNSVLTNMLPMLRPWGFAPRNATSIETAQLNEEYTATQQPLYSTLPDADDVIDVDDCANIRMAVRPNQRIIMLNKGVGGKGFTICCDCGAAMPGGDPVVLKDILRPYRSKFNKTRCRHTDTDNVNLGYDFVTDMLVLEFALDRQLIDINPQRNSWLNRAGQSLAEALRLAACQELDIEFTELVTGYRVRHNQNGDFVDVYLYDSLSSGAGYAVSIESSIQKLLTKTRELLAGCSCDSACHKCLKHYRNQYIHSVLDRKAALDLLNWGETGIRASALPDKNQQYLLQSLEQILQISGVHIDVKHDPVRAEGRYSKKKVVVYPAMWTKPVEENTIFVSDAHLKYAKPYALKTILDNL